VTAGSGYTASTKLTHHCPDIAETAGQLEREGVLVSEIRKGIKPGTKVVTVKTGCLGTPTLCIEPAT
jgi:hypothetical protein